MNKIVIVFLCVFSFLFSDTKSFSIEKIVSNIGIPWGMTFLDENRLLITLKNSQIIILNTDTKKIKTLTNPFKVFVYGQGGLLDVKVSPNYKQDSWIYFTYVKKVNGLGVTTLARAKLKNDMFYSSEDLLITKSGTKSSVHFGSRITFDELGFVYFGVGDRGYRPNAQDLNTHAGSILRLHLDGSIPNDNPFVNKKGLDEIYSYGHRNPQGLFYDKQSKKLFANEHGPRGGDEINIIEKGKNYGWPTISYGKEYFSYKSVGKGTKKAGMEQPLKVFIPSIAPSSLLVYSGKIFKNYKGDLLSSALVLRHLNRIVLDKNLNVIEEERLLLDLGERIRNVVESPNGLLYISTDSGKILKIKP